MILKRFYEERIAQASYLIGCPGAGTAIIIDPNRNLDQYYKAARDEGLRIVGVTETHIHADYVSGSRQLADEMKATLYLSDEGGPDWRYAFRGEENVKTVCDGDEIVIGAVRLQVRHTPGHTPEHISFIIVDEPASERPMGLLSGDFVFVGDVGRPDLLEKAANIRGTMEAGAKDLYRSIQKLLQLPDGTLIWPGHGAGSACGKSLGAVPVTSVGYERSSNWALRTKSEAAFLSEVLKGQPEPPKYFSRMKTINRSGPPSVDFSKPCDPLSPAQLPKTAREGEFLIDIRDSAKVAEGYIPGAVAIPTGKTLVTWAGWLAPADKPIYLIAENQEQATKARQGLSLIGFDDVVGWFDEAAVSEYAKASELAKVSSIEPLQATAFCETNGASVLDVRWSSEFVEGHIPGATNVPLGYLEERIGEVPDDTCLVHCQSGVRSLIAVTLLRRLGRQGMVNLRGGFASYQEAGRPVETEYGEESDTTAVSV